jgi:AP-1 complex subunit gamma-1
MTGYPTHFGQLECMKLIASPHFPEKRIGYLGMMLLLSEEADVLMLSTNALKNDLTSDNRFVSGLALCAIGNLATADMSRDLAPEVDKHLKSSQPYLRKKACLAMARCLTKCPEMVEDFVDRVVTLLKDRSHGVLVTVVQLMTQVLLVEQKNKDYGLDDEFGTPCQEAFVKLVPSLVKLLRNVISGGYAANDAGGATDTFLQVHILTLLRLLGTGDVQASEEMNDVLAQVATNTETSKNAGNAILYECVQTIMAVESDDGLRVLAVNILGRFLLNRDNNIRYVALNTLSKCVVDEKRSAQDELLESSGEGANNAASALQKHRTTVVDCLKDPDVSIRQRALELIYHLVNSANVESLTAELLNYLVLCPREHRSDICTRILRVVEKYSPNDRWRVDTLITMLTIAGREAARAVQNASIIYISRSSEDLRAYATHKLLKAIRDDDGSQRALLVVGVWCIGEYGDLLLKPYSYTSSTATDMASMTGSDGDNSSSVSFMGNEPSSVLATLEEVINRHTCTEEAKEHALTAFTKLCERFANVGDASTLSRLQGLVKKNSKSHALELQLRSCEYDALINAMKGVKASGAGGDDIFGTNGGGGVSEGIIAAAKEALVRMPVVDLSVMNKQRSSEYGGQGNGDVGGADMPLAPMSKNNDDLLDLEDIFAVGNGASSQPSEMTTSQTEVTTNGAAPTSDLDLLSDIFSTPAAPPPAPATGPSPSMNGNGASYDPFGAVAPTENHQPVASLNSFAPTPTSNPTSMQMNNSTVVDDVFGAATPAPANIIVPGPTYQGVVIEFECTKPDLTNNTKSTLLAKFRNTNIAPIHGLSLQIAVPKYVSMEMNPPTSTTVAPSGGNNSSEVTQTISIANNKLGQKNLMLKVKLSFTLNGSKVDHMATVSGFPAGEY